MKEFASDWSRQKLLCYDVRAALVSTLGYLELIEARTTEEITAQNAIQGALKNTRFAVEKVEELFREICATENVQ